MGKVFVHKPLKRAELRALERGPEELPSPQRTAPPAQSNEDVVEIITDGESIKFKRKEFNGVLRSVQRAKDREFHSRYMKLRDMTLKAITVEQYDMKQLAEIIARDDSKEEILKDIKLETIFDYLGELITGWSPACLHCQVLFGKQHAKIMKNIALFRIEAPEDIGLVNPIGEGAKEVWLAVGLCNHCYDKKPEIHKRRFINLLMIIDEPLNMRFFGNLEGNHGRLQVGGPRKRRTKM